MWAVPRHQYTETALSRMLDGTRARHPLAQMSCSGRSEAATLRHYIGLRQTREVPPERAQKLREHATEGTVGPFHRLKSNRGRRTAAVRSRAINRLSLSHSSSRSRRTASLAGFFDLSHTFDGPLRWGVPLNRH